MQTRIEMIDMARAKQLFETNFELNRRVNSTRLSQLIADMKAGRFIANGDTIRIDKNGKLIDGQHRLLAILATGIAVESVVVWDIDPKAVLTIDTGMARTAAHLLKMSGSEAPNASSMTAVARSVIMYQQDKTQPSKPEIADFAIAHEKEISHAVHLATPVTKVFKGGIGLYGCSAYVLNKVDPEWSVEFFAALSEGDSLLKGDPILALRNYLVKSQRTSSTKWGLLDGLSPIFRTWNLWRQGKTVKSISASRSGFPEPK